MEGRSYHRLSSVSQKRHSVEEGKTSSFFVSAYGKAPPPAPDRERAEYPALLSCGVRGFGAKERSGDGGGSNYPAWKGVSYFARE